MEGVFVSAFCDVGARPYGHGGRPVALVGRGDVFKCFARKRKDYVMKADESTEKFGW